MSHHSGENHDGFTPSWRLTQAAADRERRAKRGALVAKYKQVIEIGRRRRWTMESDN